ncbi:unnamed protein product [Brugia pahangi]|uniref:Transposase n=1 Tax=Brugia pahangi TaxID=6280 RepID=A0A0N4SZF6_BRUPA|nr:unnamed protein product [Brugia pahangi]
MSTKIELQYSEFHKHINRKTVVNEPACAAVQRHTSRVPLTLSLWYTGLLRQKHTVGLSSQTEQQLHDYITID